MVEAPLQYLLSAREYEVLRSALALSPQKRFEHGDSKFLRSPSASHDHNAAAFRSSLRVFLATKGAFKTWELISARLLGRGSSRSKGPSKPVVAASTRVALSASSFLFFYRLLFGFLTRLRLKLLQEKARRVRERYPKLYAALTSRLAPAVGASLAGLSLGICPAGQLRVTVAIYCISRGLEYLYNALSAEGYMTKKPRWMGSWMINAVSQGQLLHAFVFDRDCFPQEYWDFILKHTPDYIQRRPSDLSPNVAWPTADQIVASLAEMARLRWPPFISPIVRPTATPHLPPTINPIISPITSRAHPAIPNLSCALIHPSEQSCFTAYLQQNLKAFPKMARFFTIYYAAFSILRYKQFIKKPVTSINKLAAQILSTTASIAGAIGVSWGSICLFQTILPRAFLPRFRFFLGGLLGGTFALLDQGSAGHTNNMYAARTSVDSLWKVGVKHGWWKGFSGGDVVLYTVGWALISAVCDYEGERVIDKIRGRYMFKLLRGEADLGLMNAPRQTAGQDEMKEK